MEVKKIKNLASSSRKKPKRDITYRIHRLFHQIRQIAPRTTFMYFLLIIFTYIDILHMVINRKYVPDLSQSYVGKVYDFINYLTIEFYARSFFGNTKYILFWFFSLLFITDKIMLIILFCIQKTKKLLIINAMYYFLGISILLTDSFTVSLNVLFGIFFFQNNPLYFEPEEANQRNVLYMIMAIIGIINVILNNAFMIVYLYSDNPFIKVRFKGSNKVFQALVAAEKCIFALYLFVDSTGIMKQQFFLFILALNIFKIYLKINTNPYFCLDINKFENLFEGIFVSSIIAINLYNLLTPTDSSTFLILCLLFSFLFAFVYKIAFTRINLRGFVYKKKSSITEANAVNVVTCLIIAYENQQHKSYYLKAICYVKSHHAACEDPYCNCSQIFVNGTSSFALDEKYLRFIEMTILKFHKQFPRNITLLIHLLSIFVFKRKKFFKCVNFYNLSKSLKLNFMEVFELFVIRKTIKREIIKAAITDNIKREQSFLGFVYFSFQTRHIIKDIETLLVDSAILWEDLIQKNNDGRYIFERAYRLSKGCMDLYERAVIASETHVEKLFLFIFHNFLKTIGYKEKVFKEFALNLLKNLEYPHIKAIKVDQDLIYLQNNYVLFLLSVEQESLGKIFFASHSVHRLLQYRPISLMNTSIKNLLIHGKLTRN